MESTREKNSRTAWELRANSTKKAADEILLVVDFGTVNPVRNVGVAASGLAGRAGGRL